MKNILNYIVLVILLTGCSSSGDRTEVSKAPLNPNILFSEQQLKNAGIKSDTLQHKSISALVKVSGIVEVPPQNYISISAPLGGFLKSTELLPGEKIKKGQVLAILEDQQYIQLQEQYLATKAKLNFASLELSRQKELNKNKASSDKALEQADADMLSLRAAIAGLKEKLSMVGISAEGLTEENMSRLVPIKSPIDGYVAKVFVNVGKYVGPQDVLFELVNPEDIHLALTVFEKDIDKIAVGQKVKAYTNHSDKIYPCEVILLGRNLNPERSIDVHCHFEEYDHSLLPGMYMNAEIETGARTVAVLPTAAFVDYEGHTYLFEEVQKGQFKMIEVLKGSAEEDYTELLQANTWKNKKVVIAGAYSLLMMVKNTEEE